MGRRIRNPMLYPLSYGTRIVHAKALFHFSYQREWFRPACAGPCELRLDRTRPAFCSSLAATGSPRRLVATSLPGGSFSS